MHQLPQLLTEIGSLRAKRFFLIANNDKIETNIILDSISKDDDVVVQYNSCIFNKSFAGEGIKSTVFCSMNDINLLPGGYNYWGRPPIDDKDYPEALSVFLASSKVIAQGENERAMYPRLPERRFLLDVEKLETIGPPIAPRFIYSAGMSSIAVLTALNVERALHGEEPAQIVLCGFTGRYEGVGWLGHDFTSEQNALRFLPNLYRLTAQGIEQWSSIPVQDGLFAKILRVLGRRNGDEADERSFATDMLGRVFGQQKDYTTEEKDNLIFDISRLYFYNGDIEEFLRINKHLLAISQNHPQRRLRWIKQAGELTKGDKRKKSVSDGLGEWGKYYNSLQGKLAFRGFFEGHNVDLTPLGSQAAYKLGDTTSTRVLLVNDTASMFYNRFHAGCAIVGLQLRSELAARHIEIAGWTNGLQGLSQIMRLDPALNFQAVVVNGEGTMHHDADRAFEIANMVHFFKSIGKQVFLLNTVWQQNSTYLNDLCKSADLFTVRESQSLDAVTRFRSDVRIVPDLCWNFSETAEKTPSAGLGFQDSVVDANSDLLRRLAAASGQPLYVMHRYYETLRMEFLAETPEHLLPCVLTQNNVGSYECWLTGRFHGLILALLNRRPTVSLSSNTAKIEAMLGDIGISEKRLSVESASEMNGPVDVDKVFSGSRNYAEGDWDRVEKYRSTARQLITELFDEIAARLAKR